MPHAHTHRRRYVGSEIKTLAFLPLDHRLAVVMVLAKTLQVAAVSEQIPVALMWDNVVDYCCSHSLALGCTLSAPGLSQQLRWPEVICPDRQLVPAMILSAGLALVLGLMLGTPTVSRQLGTASVHARTQWLACHGLSPPTRKKARANINRMVGISSGLVGSGYP